MISPQNGNTRGGLPGIPLYWQPWQVAKGRLWRAPRKLSMLVYFTFCI